MKLYRALLVLAALSLPVACNLTPEEREGARQGAVAGASEFFSTIPEAATAMETGGWTAALLTLIFGAVKGVQKGMSVSRAKQIETVAEGVKKANGRTLP